MIKIILEKCPQNHPCPSIRVCPKDALSQVGFEAPKVDYDKCVGCDVCVNYCPTGAIVSKKNR